MKGILFGALALSMLIGGGKAYAYDSDRAFQEPGNALVAPFDAREGRTTFLLASNVGDKKLTTHWAFWSDSCSHLADVSICLTQDDTVVVDPASVSAVNEANDQVGPKVNLSGKAGFVTITAYEANENCDNPGRSGEVLVDDTLLGSYTIADLSTTASFGASPLVLGLDESGTYTDLPNKVVTEINAETFAPGDLAAATVYAISLEERGGESQGFAGEVGPIKGQVVAASSYFDNLEIRTSLPDLTFGCAAELDLLQYLSPLEGATAGILRLSDLRIVDGGSETEIGGTTAVYGIVAEAVGPFGVVLQPTYKYTSLE
jgi:hypothetical protein